MKNLFLIEANDPIELSNWLQARPANYQIIYQQAIIDPEQHINNQEEIWKKELLLASQDQERNQEIAQWDKITSQI